MQQANIDSVAGLAILVGSLRERIEEQDKRIQELEDSRVTLRKWVKDYVLPRLNKNPRSGTRTSPKNTVSKEDADLAYQIIREHTGRNYQVDSVFGDKCRALIAKHSLETVCKVVAHACVQNAAKGADQWSQPSTLFRPANFTRWLDDWRAGNE